VLLLLADGTKVPVAELPGEGPWTFLVLQPAPPPPAPAFLTRFGRVVVPDLRGRPGWGAAPGQPAFLDLVDDLDQVRTRAGLGRPVLVGLDGLAPLARRAAADQPWAWRALLVTGPADLAGLGLPALTLGSDPAPAVEELLGRLGPGPGWAGIAPDAPPR
jgi:pimeloyl-ACP methyl ester carboxylesterase